MKIKKNSRSVRCVLVGDGAVGKTSLAHVASNKPIPQRYEPTIFENYAVPVSVTGDAFVVGVLDTPGQEENINIRSFSYVQSDAVIICFSVAHPDSFQNVQSWAEEVKMFTKGKKPVVLVGTQTDLRELSMDSSEKISTKQGESMARTIGAQYYIECSAVTSAGVQCVFEQVVLATVKYRKQKFAFPHLLGCIFGR